jgi:methylated-DNA-protein-cysteine methyltransferase-like protein
MNSIHHRGLHEESKGHNTMPSDQNPYQAIYDVVRRIPHGQVSSYGRVAIIAGLPGHGRMVGYALHALHGDTSVPWWRVINASGYISNAYSREHQRSRLEAEGITVDQRDRVDLEVYLWDGS